MNLINFGKSLKQTIMTKSQFQNEFLNPLVENFFSKLIDFLGISAIDFFRQNEPYFKEFVFRKLPKYGKEMQSLEIQREFVKYYFGNNPKYDLFKPKIRFEKEKLCYLIPTAKNKEDNDRMTKEIETFYMFKKMVDDNDISNVTIEIRKKIKEIRANVKTIPKNTNSDLKISLDARFFLKDILDLYYNLLHFFYGKMTNNDEKQPMDSDLLSYMQNEKQNFEYMNKRRNKRKKQIAEVFDNYFKPQNNSKIEKYNDIYAELGWGITEEEYEQIEKTVSSDLREYLDYKIVKERYYDSVQKNRKDDD